MIEQASLVDCEVRHPIATVERDLSTVDQTKKCAMHAQQNAKDYRIHALDTQVVQSDSARTRAGVDTGRLGQSRV